jgi:hypothetical protein
MVVALLSLSLSQKVAEELDVGFKSSIMEVNVCRTSVTLCISIYLVLCSRARLNIEMYIYHRQRVDLLSVQNRRACCDIYGAFCLPLQSKVQRSKMMSRSLFSITHSNQDIYILLAATLSSPASSLCFYSKRRRLDPCVALLFLPLAQKIKNIVSKSHSEISAKHHIYVCFASLFLHSQSIRYSNACSVRKPSSSNFMSAALLSPFICNSKEDKDELYV